MSLASSFARRFTLASIDAESGVLLDLETGEFYRVDAPGVVVCRALARGVGVTGAGAALARDFAVSQKRAEADVRTLLASFAPRQKSRRERGPVTFGVAGGRFSMLVGRRVALHVDRETGRVEIPRASRALLRLVAPHVLALRGHTVLHASAARIGKKIVAFVGPSGVGKSTIARILKSLGAPVISRDLVVMGDAGHALLAGEAAIARWSRRSARCIEASPLGAAAGGPSKTLDAILVVERGARFSDLRIDELRGAAAIAALLENAFVELPEPRVWRLALAAGEDLAARRIVHRARVPEGRMALRRELSAWVAGGASLTRRT